jgi:membrane-associated protease RseP (regulator of RpoE activity)
MNRLFILIPGLFVLGIAAGIGVMVVLDLDKPLQVDVELPALPISATATEHPMANAFVASQASDEERIQVLEAQIVSLSERIERLSAQMLATEQQDNEGTGALAIAPPSTVDTPITRANPALTVDKLIRAGIDPLLAADIVRRKNEIDLKTLELRDRASREGYLGTRRYNDELNNLLQQNVSLRDEIGDDAYDSYLFASGQSNRVKIASVMMGSPAEQAGIRNGDLVVSYDNRQMFGWNELQDATTWGERGEYVNITVLRNGELVNLWIPRGPLGVRLGSARIKP